MGCLTILASKVSCTEISFCTVRDLNKVESNGGTLDIDLKGGVFFVDDFGDNYLAIAPTFEQFLEGIEFIKEEEE